MQWLTQPASTDSSNLVVLLGCAFLHDVWRNRCLRLLRAHRPRSTFC